MTATLQVSRNTALVELRRGTFEIEVDGRNTGSIEHGGDPVTETVQPGHHTLRIRSGRLASRAHQFDAADGQVVTFNCHGANLWFVWLGSFIVPSLGIWLKRE